VHALQQVHRRLPENAIDFSYQIDLEKCKAIANACGLREIGAVISRARSALAKRAFDLVLDLSRSRCCACPTCRRATSRPGPIRSSRRSPRRN